MFLLFFWACSVGGQTVGGNDLFGFREFCQQLSEAAGHDCIMLCYNTTEFFQFVRKYFDIVSVFADKEREPLDALLTPVLHLRSGKMLSGMTLQEIGKQYGCRVRAPSFEYPALAPGSCIPLDVVEMIQEEARAMELLLSDHIKRAGNIAKVPLTKTGYVRRFLRDRLLWGRGEGADKQDFFASIEYRKVMQATQLTETEYRFLDGVSCGSICAFRPDRRGKVDRSVLYWDRKSAYPAHILYDYVPNGIAKHFEAPVMARVEEAMKARCVAGLFRFKSIRVQRRDRPVYLRESMVESAEAVDEKSGFIMRAKVLTVYLTELDYQSLRECYFWKDCECLECIVYQRGVMPYRIKKYTLARFAAKETETDPALRRVNKEMLNAIYGIFVTNPVREQYTYDQDGAEWEKPELPDIPAAIADYNNNPSRFYRFCWGVWIAAHCRRAEWRAWTACREYFVYGDTDSALVRVAKHPYYEHFFREENDRILTRAREEAEALRVPMEMFMPAGELLGAWICSKAVYRISINGIKNYIQDDGEGHMKVVMAGIDPDLSGEYVRRKYGARAVDEFATITYYPSRWRDLRTGEIFSATGRKIRTHQDFEVTGHFLDADGIRQEFTTLSGLVQNFAPVTRREIEKYNAQKQESNS